VTLEGDWPKYWRSGTPWLRGGLLVVLRDCRIPTEGLTGTSGDLVVHRSDTVSAWNDGVDEVVGPPYNTTRQTSDSTEKERASDAD